MTMTARHKRLLVYIMLAALVGIAYWLFPQDVTGVANTIGYVVTAIFVLLLLGGIALAVFLARKKGGRAHKEEKHASERRSQDKSRGGRGWNAWKIVKWVAIAAILISAFWWGPRLYAEVEGWFTDPCMRRNSSIDWNQTPPGASGTMPSKASGEFSLPAKRIPGFVNCLNLSSDSYLRQLDQNGDEVFQSTAGEREFEIRRVPE